MIISNVIGGLGNQMFQYACGRAVSLRTKQPLYMATDQFDGYKLHYGFELNRVFNIEAQEVAPCEIRRLLSWQARPRVRQLLGRPAMHWATGRNWANEPHFHYWPGIKYVRGSKYIHGYWQSERYFADVAEQIRQDFFFQMPWDESDLAVRDRMRHHPCASMHVRRGDYALKKNRDIFGLCDLDYYRSAVQILRTRVPGVRLFVFSDDPDWFEGQMGPALGQYEIVRHNSGRRNANDMRLMSLANHHIIANSSFSWWGAWLNPTVDKIIVTPKQWFLDGTNDMDLIPSSWMRI